MKRITFALVCVALSGPAFSGPLTCWYNAEGQSKGADSGSHNVPESQFGTLVKSPEEHGSDNAFSLVLTEWSDGNSCPKTVDTTNVGNRAKSSLPSLDDAQETCGNNRDLTLRAQGCSDIISNPLASTQDVTWALWSRAYVRCGTADNNDVIADLMTAARLDPKHWQKYFQKAGGYTGSVDGKLNMDLYESVSRYVKGGCR